jgi:hypothetical protein
MGSQLDQRHKAETSLPQYAHYHQCRISTTRISWRLGEKRRSFGGYWCKIETRGTVYKRLYFDVTQDVKGEIRDLRTRGRAFERRHQRFDHRFNSVLCKVPAGQLDTRRLAKFRGDLKLQNTEFRVKAKCEPKFHISAN